MKNVLKKVELIDLNSPPASITIIIASTSGE